MAFSPEVLPMVLVNKAKEFGRRLPREAESVVLTSHVAAFYYAKDVVKGRWREGEPVMAKDGLCSFCYAVEVLHARFVAGEEAISRGVWRKSYLRAYREARDDWMANGWIDWMDSCDYD